MSSPTTTKSDDSTELQNRQWFIVGRWQEFEGEILANTLRLVAVGCFYIVELVNYHGLSLGLLDIPASIDRKVHLTITGLVVAWVMLALGVAVMLRERVFPPGLKFLTTTLDLVVLTCILMVGDGPKSPMVVGYFLVMLLASLRFQLRLVWCSTLGSLAGYMTLLGYAKWYAPERGLVVPRYHQLLILLAIALAGIMLGRLIRRVRALAQDYHRRLSAFEGRSEKQ